jgi:hypothetical protein
MNTWKEEARQAIATLPETASFDDLMYHLYVVNKVNKGLEEAKRGEGISLEEMKRKVESW